MSTGTGIEWTRGDDGTAGTTWNPVTGCTKVSEGCDHCYAETFAERWRGVPGHHFERGFDVTLRPERLIQPLYWKKPRRVFVNSMSDLFHTRVPDEFIAHVFVMMALAPRHTFMVLTKRPGRMRSLLGSGSRWRGLMHDTADWVAHQELPVTVRRGSERFAALLGGERPHGLWPGTDVPVPNVWLGVSVENQPWWDIRVPALLETPAVVRFVSAEPLLGPIDMGLDSGGPAPDWVIVGSESGRGARPMDLAWARSAVAQCQAASVPVFVKQLGSAAGRELGAGPKGGDQSGWPDELKVREFPRAGREVTGS